MRKLDVVIVGGGPAGSATALFLAHAAPSLKQRVVVLEKERYPREKYCAGGLGARADALLGSIGVTVDVPSVPVDAIAYRAMGQTRIVREPGLGRVIRRIEFDHALARAVEERGVEVRSGVRVLGLRRAGAGFELETSDGPLFAKVVVGADGVQSVVRRSLGFSSGRWRAQALEVDTEPVESDLPRDTILFDTSHRELPGYYWDFPTLVDGREMVVRGAYLLRRVEAPAQVEIQSLLERELRLRGLDLGKLRKKRYAELAFDPHAPIAQPNVLLVGESAGIDPVTGEGIAQALFYGAAAGRYLAEKLSHRDLGFEDWPWVIRRQHIGRDLVVRAAGVPLFYGAPRPNVERFLLDVPDFIRVGAQHFAGKPWSKLALARAAWGAVRHTARFVFGLSPEPARDGETRPIAAEN